MRFREYCVGPNNHIIVRIKCILCLFLRQTISLVDVFGFFIYRRTTQTNKSVYRCCKVLLCSWKKLHHGFCGSRGPYGKCLPSLMSPESASAGAEDYKSTYISPSPQVQEVCAATITLQFLTELFAVKLHCGYCRHQVLTRKKNVWVKEKSTTLILILFKNCPSWLSCQWRARTREVKLAIPHINILNTSTNPVLEMFSIFTILIYKVYDIIGLLLHSCESSILMLIQLVTLHHCLNLHCNEGKS